MTGMVKLKALKQSTTEQFQNSQYGVVEAEMKHSLLGMSSIVLWTSVSQLAHYNPQVQKNVENHGKGEYGKRSGKLFIKFQAEATQTSDTRCAAGPSPKH